MNLNELAKLLAVSLPTMRALIGRFDDMPVIDRGGLGKPWIFDAEAVIEYVQARRQDEEDSRAEKDELLAQLVLPISKAPNKDGKPLSYKDEIDAAKLRKLLRDEEIETRFLVSTLEVRNTLEKLLRALASNMSAALSSIQREHNIPEPVMSAIRAKFDNARVAFVRDAGEMLAAPEPASDTGEFRLAAE